MTWKCLTMTGLNNIFAIHKPVSIPRNHREIPGNTVAAGEAPLIHLSTRLWFIIRSGGEAEAEAPCRVMWLYNLFCKQDHWVNNWLTGTWTGRESSATCKHMHLVLTYTTRHYNSHILFLIDILPYSVNRWGWPLYLKTPFCHNEYDLITHRNTCCHKQYSRYTSFAAAVHWGDP